MTRLANTLAHVAARNAASIALADQESGNSTLRLYTTFGGALLAVRTLAKPCGVVRPLDGRIVLNMGSVDEVALATGSALWGEWCDGSGVPISAGRVTDQAGRFTDSMGAVVADPEGLGPFVLGGRGGSVGGTMVYAGGLVLLYAGVIG